MDGKIIKELDTLFECVAPAELREQITMIFFQYLASDAESVMDDKFKKLSENIYFLIRFLEIAEKGRITRNKFSN